MTATVPLTPLPKHLLRVTVGLTDVAGNKTTPTNLGEFDSFSGGGSKSEPTMYRAGGSLSQTPLPALQATEPLKVVRGYRHTDDMDLYDKNVGKGKVSVTFQPLDANHQPIGTAIVRTGLLANVKWPEGDSNSNEVATMELEIALDGSV